MALNENDIGYNENKPELKITSMFIEGQSLTFITRDVQPSVIKVSPPPHLVDSETIDTFKTIALNYIKKPIILDTFDSHTQRREWRDKLKGNNRDIVLKNKLILSSIGGLQLIIGEVKDEIVKNNKSIDVILDTELKKYDKLKKYNYKELDNIQKIEYVCNLEQIAVNLLYLLTDVYDSK